MNAFLAVLVDTWHESKKQIVFRLLLVVLVALSVAIVALPRTFESESGGEPRLGFVLADAPAQWLEDAWWQNYAAALAVEEGEAVGRPGSREFDMYVSRRRSEIEPTLDSTPYERSVQSWLQLGISGFFTLSMLAFIAACSGYFPRMMREGAIDAVVSKPTSRLNIFLGKYAGGLVLFLGALMVCHVVVFVGLGVRTGVWHGRLFTALGFEMFTAAVLYAFLAFVGLVTRSAVLTTVLGYAWYLFIDTAIGTVITLIDLGMIESDALASGATWARRLIPNFTILNGAAVTSVLTLPHLEWEPFVTAGTWTLVTLGLGYLVFRRRDF